ncbi:hypothetical protein EV356DRAFT_296808 [Viridothelium virens]|uniref:Uncharacterized protein n=1 Tax=Viridothelium virens TaxID=1048519 RepID=A0A6A6GZV3_VIRVR|nr:hypothetical protein EV356DRAFT_296808 [Viridothelium virens]
MGSYRNRKHLNGVSLLSSSYLNMELPRLTNHTSAIAQRSPTESTLGGLTKRYSEEYREGTTALKHHAIGSDSKSSQYSLRVGKDRAGTQQNIFNGLLTDVLRTLVYNLDINIADEFSNHVEVKAPAIPNITDISYFTLGDVSSSKWNVI